MSETHGRLGAVYKWNGTASDLAAEACTVNGNDAQITDADKRILNPACTDLVFSPTNSVNVVKIDYAAGRCTFDGAPGVTTVTGTSAYVATGNLVKIGFLYEWTLNIELAVQEVTAFQDDWAEFIAGLGRATGQAMGYMAGSEWWDDMEDITDGTQKYFYIELLSYDPDDDRSGDRFNCWVVFTGLNWGTPVGDYVAEQINFQVLGLPYFIANS